MVNRQIEGTFCPPKLIYLAQVTVKTVDHAISNILNTETHLDSQEERQTPQQVHNPEAPTSKDIDKQIPQRYKNLYLYSMLAFEHFASLKNCSCIASSTYTQWQLNRLPHQQSSLSRHKFKSGPKQEVYISTLECFQDNSHNF